MKKTILSLVAASLFAVCSIAQESKPPVKPTPEKPAQEKSGQEKPKQTKSPADKADRQVERMDKEVGFTPEQKTKIKEILVKRDLAREDLMKKYPEKNADFQKEMRTLNMESEKQIKAIYTPEQVEKQKKIHEEAMQRNKEEREKREKEKAEHPDNKGGKPTPATTPTVEPKKEAPKNK